MLILRCNEIWSRARYLQSASPFTKRESVLTRGRESGGYDGCCPRFTSLDRRGLMLFRLISVVVRRARLALAVFLVWEFYRLLGSLLPDRRNEKWWTTTASHRALPLARRVTS